MLSTVRSRALLLLWAAMVFARGGAFAAEEPRHLGAKTCAHCHGTAEWTKMAHHTIWSATDLHSRAFTVLSNELSQEIAGWMALEPGRPETWAKCTRCHTPNIPETLRGPHYSDADGVDCESCHGAAEHWFVPHLEFDATHERNVQLGMIDLKNLETRARLCLKCHSGLDHEIVAAGHPDLSFELFHFSFWQPPHWNYQEASPFAFWAIGQTAALETALGNLNQALVDPTTGKDLHVEAFDDKACYQCHHKLSYDRWRFVDAHYSAVRPLLKTVLAERSDGIASRMETLARLVDSPEPSSQFELLKLAHETREELKALFPSLKVGVEELAKNREALAALLSQLGDPVAEPVDEVKYPQMDIPHAWVIREYDKAEQKYLAMKTLALAIESGGRELATSDLLKLLESGELEGGSIQSIDRLWEHVDSIYPQQRRKFKPSEFNRTLEEVRAALGQ